MTAIYSCTHGVITGGKDHRVRLWTQRLEPGATFDMSHFGLLPSIRSVCLSMDGSSILIGTLGAEIYEVIFLPMYDCNLILAFERCLLSMDLI